MKFNASLHPNINLLSKREIKLRICSTILTVMVNSETAFAFRKYIAAVLNFLLLKLLYFVGTN
jgi:hypothetical protein